MNNTALSALFIGLYAPGVKLTIRRCIPCYNSQLVLTIKSTIFSTSITRMYFLTYMFCVW